MRACITIPVRMGSERFYGKPLKKINGKTMIHRVWENAKKSKIQDVFILTDSDEIIEEAKLFNADIIRTSSDVKSGTERIASVLDRLAFNVIFNLQGDEPLFKGEYIDLLYEEFIKTDSVCATCYYPLKKEEANDNNKVKVVFNSSSEALYFSRSAIPHSGPYYKHIGVYIYRADFIKRYIKMPESSLEVSEKLEQNRIIENGFKIHLVRLPTDTIGVDTPEDLKRVEEIL